MARNLYYMPTCGCVLEQEYDPADYAGTMQWTAVKRQCAAHSKVSVVDLPSLVYNEMLLASKLQNEIANLGGLVDWPDGQPSKAFAEVNNIRVVTVAVTGLNATKKLTLQTWANTLFGVGKVVVA